MSVLVSLGILTSYLFSVGLTLFAREQETFYEAAVMLAVFLLFGHWMEMKARRGSLACGATRGSYADAKYRAPP